MPHVDQLRPYKLVKLRFHLQFIGNLIVAEAGEVTGGLHIRTKVKNIHQHLHVSLALLVGAVLARDKERLAVPHHKYR